MNNVPLLYTRELPGGGYVAIKALPSDDSAFRACVAVERRSDPVRRMGHVPPIIAEAQGPSQDGVLAQLFAIASDNVALARAIQQWQAARRVPRRS